MEKALTAAGSFWISKRAKQEFSNISHDISSLSNSVEDKAKCLLNKLKGKSRKEIGDILREHNIPGGVFPSNMKCYEYEESKGKLTVHLPYPCEVCFKDSSLLRYSTRVKATLSRGKLTVLEGMKTKKLLVWVKVSSVSVESHRSDKVCFSASGGVKISRARDAYDLPRPAIQVHDF